MAGPFPSRRKIVIAHGTPRCQPARIDRSEAAEGTRKSAATARPAARCAIFPEEDSRWILTFRPRVSTHGSRRGDLDALQRAEFFYRRARRLRQGMIFATLAIAVLRVAFPDAFDSLIEKTLTMPTALSLYFSVAVFTVALEW